MTTKELQESKPGDLVFIKARIDRVNPTIVCFSVMDMNEKARTICIPIRHAEPMLLSTNKLEDLLSRKLVEDGILDDDLPDTLDAKMAELESE